MVCEVINGEYWEPMNEGGLGGILATPDWNSIRNFIKSTPRAF
jgi:hypothetical protein